MRIVCELQANFKFRAFKKVNSLSIIQWKSFYQSAPSIPTLQCLEIDNCNIHWTFIEQWVNPWKFLKDDYEQILNETEK